MVECLCLLRKQKSTPWSQRSLSLLIYGVEKVPSFCPPSFLLCLTTAFSRSSFIGVSVWLRISLGIFLSISAFLPFLHLRLYKTGVFFRRLLDFYFFDFNKDHFLPSQGAPLSSWKCCVKPCAILMGLLLLCGLLGLRRLHMFIISRKLFLLNGVSFEGKFLLFPLMLRLPSF